MGSKAREDGHAIGISFICTTLESYSSLCRAASLASPNGTRGRRWRAELGQRVAWAPGLDKGEGVVVGEGLTQRVPAGLD